MTLLSPTTSPALDETLATLDSRPPQFFISDKPSVFPARLRNFTDILNHPGHTSASANYALRTGLAAVDLPLSLALHAVLARLCPDPVPAPALARATVPIPEILTHLNSGLAGWVLESVLSNLTPAYPLGVADLVPFIAAGAVPVPPVTTQLAKRAVAQVFTTSAIDLLLSSPAPWPDVATFAPLSDTQFARYLASVSFATDVDLDPLGRTLTTSARLAVAFDVGITRGARFPDPFWSSALQRLITPADFDTIVPSLPAPYATAFAAARPVIFQLYPRDVTPERLAALTHLDPMHLFHNLITTTAPTVPSWLIARLTLRVPGFANAVLNPHSVYANPRDAVRIRAASAYTAFRVCHLLRFFGVTELAVNSLLSPGATLAQVLSALNVLKQAA